ncbi:MAG: IclR family transcriptional regulator [Bacillaceae bacterium]|nr:IclR family transcriptional regulator [Bacillaceae bacterium]
MKENHGYKSVRSVERALDILICFTDKNELSLTEISRKTSLNKSTVFRLLQTLERKGFLVRNPDTEKYRLGLRMWELSVNVTLADDIANLFLPEMTALRDALGETVSLYVRDHNERFRIQAVESNQAIRRVAPIGARMPLSLGASSKVLVAWSSPEVQEQILQDPDWIDSVDREAFKKQLEEIMQKGYATSIEEREPGTSAVAAPIFNRSGQLIAALAVSGPSSRMTPEKMEEFAPEVIQSATRMGKLVR